MTIIKNIIRMTSNMFKNNRECVGSDSLGNKYYRIIELENGAELERREVINDRAYMYLDFHKLPAEWRMWVRKQRKDPPTPEELMQSQAKAEQLKGRVALLEEAERQRKYRMAAAGVETQYADAEPRMDRFLQQLSKQQQSAKEKDVNSQ